MINNEVKFIGTVNKLIFNNKDSDFYIYAMDVDTSLFPNIKKNKYNNVTVSGKITELSYTLPYEIIAEPEEGKYGITYKIKKLNVTRPKTGEQVFAFLREILTNNQAKELYKEYPNIIDLVADNNTRIIDIKKLHGIGEITLNKIIKKIANNIILFDLISEFHGAITINILKKLYDKYSSIELLKEKLKTEPYDCLTKISGIGFIKADSILLELENNKIIDFGFDLKNSSQRCKSCMVYLLEENQNNGNTKMDLRELRQQVIKLVPNCSEFYTECLKKEEFVYNRDDFSVGLKFTYDTEKYIADIIKTMNNNPIKWDINYIQYQNKGEYSLTDEQLSALKCICENNIMILNGFGGSGKSATSSMIIKMLEDNNISYALFAPTGRAAKVLSDYTNKPASTIHRGLNYMNGKWGYNIENKLPNKVVLIDEFSMTDIFLFKHVVEAINPETTKLILIGDSAQLPSVGAGNLLQDFIKSNMIPVVTLNKIFRYADGGLMKVATDVRNSIKFLNNNITSKINTFGDDYVFIQSNNESIIKDAINLYAKLLENNKPEDILVLSSYNKGNYGTIHINNKLQKIANKNTKNDKCIIVGEIKYYIDDIIIQTSNNYSAPVYVAEDFDWSSVDDCIDECKKTFIPNGMLGRISDINNNRVIINFDGIDVIYTKNDMYNISLGYSISTHKSQGGSCKIIIFITPSSHEYMLNSNLIYVGLTRTKEKCFHIGNITSVNRAIKKKENYSRQTFMVKLLK